jgi:hypothetical protein
VGTRRLERRAQAVKVTKRQLENLMKECEFQLQRIATKLIMQPTNPYYLQSHRAFLLIQHIIKALQDGERIEVVDDNSGGDKNAR